MNVRCCPNVPAGLRVVGWVWWARCGLLCWLSVVTFAVSLQRAHAESTNEPSRDETTKRKVFSFEGGNPFDFIVALDRHFRTRLVQILTLPETLSKTKVPKLRVAANDPREVLSLYNRLDNPALGQWRFEPNGTNLNQQGTNMNVLMLVPDKAVAASKAERSVTKVKGIPLAGVPEAKWEALVRDIEVARKHGEEATKGTSDAFGGSIHIQRDSKVLIVAGSEAYLEMVESLVGAHRANAEIELKGAPGSKVAEAAR